MTADLALFHHSCSPAGRVDRVRPQRKGAPAEQITAAQDFQRKAQFHLDFVETENSTGFHAPEEALRVLGESINLARKGQLTLRPVK